MKTTILIICLIFSSISAYSIENKWEAAYQFKTDKYLLFEMDTKNNNVAIVGHNGVFFLSTDNGSTWRNIYLGTNSDLNGISFANDSTLFICGNYGTIIKYNIKTGIIEDESLSSHIFLKTISFSESNIGLAGCMKGRLFRTTNYGKTWDSVFSVKEMGIKSIIFKNSQEVFLSCAKRSSDSSEIYYSNDAGLKWEIKAVLNNEKINTMLYTDNELWIGGSYGLLASSKDDGKNWEFYNFDVNAPIWGINKFNNEIYVACGWEDNGIVKVIPGTNNFYSDLSSYGNTLFNISSNNSYLFTVNHRLGIIYRKQK